MDKTYIIGHKSPDLDSVAAAVSYAALKNKVESTDQYIPAVAGDINKETKFVLDKFGFDIPELLDSAKNENVILVDHNEFSHAVDGMSEANIIEVLDHHKVNFSYSEPISFKILPCGASCSIVASEFVSNRIEIDKKLAGLMLAAVLVDTVITKSPTCTDKDVEIIEMLAKVADIKDWKEYGMEIFQVRSSISDLSTEDIIKRDFKDFEFKAGKIGVGQVETVDLSELEPREDDMLAAMDEIREREGYHSVILFITDIINEGSKFLVSSSDPKAVEDALETKLENRRVYIPGVLSRKKQVTPKLTAKFDQ